MDDDRGQALVLVVGVVSVAAVAVLAVAGAGARLVAQQRARAGADAAALAAVVAGVEGAERMCRRNACTVVAVRDDGDGVVVTVDVAGVRATSRATLRQVP